jgi:hypothetical protein
MKHLVAQCSLYASDGYSDDEFPIDIVRLCNSLLAHFPDDIAKAQSSSLLHDRLSSWATLWQELSSAMVYYMTYKRWSYGARETEAIIKRKIPIPLLTPAEVLAQDRRLAEDCLERIASLEKELSFLNDHFPNGLAEALGRFVLPERRERFSVLERIPKGSLGNDLEDDIDDSIESTDSYDQVKHMRGKSETGTSGSTQAANVSIADDELHRSMNISSQALRALKDVARETTDDEHVAGRVDEATASGIWHVVDSQAHNSNRSMAKTSSIKMPEKSSISSQSIAESLLLPPLDGYRRDTGDDETMSSYVPSERAVRERSTYAGVKLVQTTAVIGDQSNDATTPQNSGHVDRNPYGGDCCNETGVADEHPSTALKPMMVSTHRK